MLGATGRIDESIALFEKAVHFYRKEDQIYPQDRLMLYADFASSYIVVLMQAKTPEATKAAAEKVLSHIETAFQGETIDQPEKMPAAARANFIAAIAAHQKGEEALAWDKIHAAQKWAGKLGTKEETFFAYGDYKGFLSEVAAKMPEPKS